MKKSHLFKIYYNMVIMMNMKMVGFTDPLNAAYHALSIEKDLEEMSELVDAIREELVEMYDGDSEAALAGIEKYIYTDPFYKITSELADDEQIDFDAAKAEIN